MYTYIRSSSVLLILMQYGVSSKIITTIVYKTRIWKYLHFFINVNSNRHVDYAAICVQT